MYFNTPRLMDNIATELFAGDFWDAHHFQNQMINAKILKTVNIEISLPQGKTSKIHIVNYNWEPK